MLLPRMIDDAMKLTVDQIFPKKRNPQIQEITSSFYKVTNYSDTENMWEYLCQIGMVRAPINIKASTSSLYKMPLKGINSVPTAQSEIFEDQAKEETKECNPPKEESTEGR